MKMLKKELAREIRELCDKKVAYLEPLITKMHKDLKNQWKIKYDLYEDFWNQHSEEDMSNFYLLAHTRAQVLDIYGKLISLKSGSIDKWEKLSGEEEWMISQSEFEQMKAYLSLAKNEKNCLEF